MNGKTCNDINNGQDVKKVMRIFLWFMNENIRYYLIIKKKIGIVISMLVNNIVNIATPFICF